MTDTAPIDHAPKPVRRRNADYRWTARKVTAFLRALSASGSVAQAAREVGMSRQSAYALKARLAHPDFQQMWTLARRTGLAARARAAVLAEASPWGEAGLAAFAHLRRPAQADTSTAQACIRPAQADVRAAQVDTLTAHADTFGPQADGLPLDTVPGVPGSPGNALRNRAVGSRVVGG